jgi:protoheme IX farnesyltransferase
MSTTRVTIWPAAERGWVWLQLTKPDVTFLVVITTFAGYWMAPQALSGQAAPAAVDLLRLFHCVLGTLLIAGGTSSLNQYFEREEDAVMRRTARRPLPLGIVSPGEVLRFGWLLVAAGSMYLLLFSGWLAAVVGAATSTLYLGTYTPLKKKSAWATFVGAFPGAAPPLIGWAAATGNLSAEAWLLFLILFLWQFPHFLAIAWMYREDYARAGIRMVSVGDAQGRATYRQILGFAAALIPASLLPAVAGLAGVRYFFGALVLSMALMQTSLWASHEKSNWRAKWLMHATVAYIPALLGLMIFDKAVR